MYKLVAIDLDGTLLNSFGEVTENTKNVLLEAKEKGIEIVLASGRPISSTKSLAVEIGLDNYIISGNGAVVYDIKNEAVVYDKFLSKEQVFNVIDVCEANSIFYNIYTEDEVITKSLNYNVLFYLMSRGINKDKAYNLLVKGFLLGINKNDIYLEHIDKYWR